MHYQLIYLPLKDSQSKKLGGWVATTAGRQPEDLRVRWLDIPEKARDIPETNKQSAGLAEGADGRVNVRGKTAEERGGRGLQHGEGNHMPAQFNTQGVCDKTSAKAKSPSPSGFCPSSWFLRSVLVAKHLLPIPQNTQDSHSAPFLPSTLQRDVQVGSGGPGGRNGAGRVKSKPIHLLPRLSSWLAAGPGPALTQPDAKHQHIHTTGRHTSKNHYAVKVYLQCYFSYMEREMISRWPPTRNSCPIGQRPGKYIDGNISERL